MSKVGELFAWGLLLVIVHKKKQMGYNCKKKYPDETYEHFAVMCTKNTEDWSPMSLYPIHILNCSKLEEYITIINFAQTLILKNKKRYIYYLFLTKSPEEHYTQEFQNFMTILRHVQRSVWLPQEKINNRCCPYFQQEKLNFTL